MTATPNGHVRLGEGRATLRAVPEPATTSQQEAATEGEVPIGTSDGASVSETGPTRGTRVYAYARNVVLTAGSRVTNRDTWLRLARWLWAAPSPEGDPTVGGMFRPPDVWTKDRPSLRRILAYARWGTQHPASGLLRALSVAYVVVGLVVLAGFYYAAWLVERPARLAAGYGLLAVLMQIPAVREAAVVAASVLIAPLTWLA